MNIYTKESLIAALQSICSQGWISNARHGNVGGIGNTLEDLLGITENNLPIPNANEWELKTQRSHTTSLTTLFHMEPSPRALHFVPEMFLLKYGWPHEFAGHLYPDTEMSFRQTIHGQHRSDRGFGVVVDAKERKLLVSFDHKYVAPRHNDWLNSVQQRVGTLKELDPQPYWGFDDLYAKARTKLTNCFYVRADVQRKPDGTELYKYHNILICEKFSLDKFLSALQNGNILVDFDARTGHNHGTKFRLRQDKMPELYDSVTLVE
ncbi:MULTISPECIES: MvaI/BcnI family restriction endonuclease [Dehalococcoides]|uniref:MvaI/BcnI family restriction endonuclease n=1 Tax=Dehalococcoides TaxID=61434 RepID=UPI0005B57278|nr:MULTISPECIES: MvaI/BcnI family restriction endonuclease [Dehalococcoides]QYY57974.1 MvaI/BcnI family restriction endonuclease [Dehalococcoides mccartyi]BAQ34748.1 hypothetical protein UCH007_07900 [Dehalococcoides sp. UCH007]